MAIALQLLGAGSDGWEMASRFRQVEGVAKVAPLPWVAAKPARVLIAAAGITTVVLLAAGRIPNRSSRLAVMETAANPPATASAPAALGFGAETRNGDLWLTWNRDAAAIKSATSGVLTVEDRDSTRELYLGEAMVRSGAFRVSSKSGYVKASLAIPGLGAAAREWVIAVLPPNRSSAPASSRRALSPLPKEPAAQAATDQKPAAPTPHTDRSSKSLATRLASDPAAAIEDLGRDTRPAPTELEPNLKTLVPCPLENTTMSPCESGDSRAVRPVDPGPNQAVTGLDIQVSIDDAGKVVAAEIVAQNGVDKQFAEAALNLARMWKFEPTLSASGVREKTLHLRQPAYH
jgi:hypothetical protein